MTERLFRFYPSDFGEIPVRVIHMDLTFDVHDDFTNVTSVLTAESRDRPLQELVLNAKNLEVTSVECAERECSYRYDAQASLLQITFMEPVPPRTRFSIHTVTTCRPTKNILEGLYYDETPPGAPPQQITQCQQWGFQRLVPCIDDMTAKCTFTTTVIADERYTNIITNGDPVGGREPAGPGRVRVRYQNAVTPMAPYLLFLGCGTYATFRRDCEYPDGRSFWLELLVPPGADPDRAERALDILHDAVLWVHLFTGPGRYDQPEVRNRIYTLMAERDRLKKADTGSPQLAGIRLELSGLAQQVVPGYTYTGAVYREIGMQNSDYGGMENVGNTTITTNRIMPFPAMTDPAFEYMARVKVHEFYHNLNGSEVTGCSPFEIWLNEAVTVHIEREYHAFHFGKNYSRLQAVLALLAPGSGTLALDSGAASMPIEPEGFNDPNELITDITYMKGPEFVRMIEILMGSEKFVQGLDLYHRTYRHGNATRAQWIRAMEEVAGQNFSAMAEGWLRRTGFPNLSVRAAYNNERKLETLHLSQTGNGGKNPWIFPFRLALTDAVGKEIADITVRVEHAEQEIVIPSREPPEFLSLNRGFSFYGRVAYEATLEELYRQVASDRDMVNRFAAFTAIMDQEKMDLLLHKKAEPDEQCTDLFIQVLSDRDLMGECGGQFLTIFESVPDEQYAHRYQALYEIREKILRAVAARHREALLDIYRAWDIPQPAGSRGLADEILAIKRRQVKNTALSVLLRLDTPEIHQLIREQFRSGTSATDRLVAFVLYMDSSAPDRSDMLALFGQESGRNPVSWENFLGAVAGNSSPEAVDLVIQAGQSDAFRIEQANDQRALYVRFALNRKKSLQTEAGRKFLAQTLLRLASINEYSTGAMLRVFGPLDRMEAEYHVPLVAILAELLANLDPATTPSVYNTARRILRGNPAAVERYERERGAIPGLHR
jgi:aminopeptidase N